MTFSTLILLLAFVAFLAVAVGWTFRKTDLVAVGLALWSLSELVARISSLTIGTVFLLLAFIAFVLAAIGWRYRKFALIGVGLALWVLSVLIGSVHFG